MGIKVAVILTAFFFQQKNKSRCSYVTNKKDSEDLGEVQRFPDGNINQCWFFNKSSTEKQQNVSLMREHREQYGLSGNCFDLALWLLDEFNKDGVDAYPVGHNLNTTEDAHVAVIAMNEKGNRYLCDLEDQWLSPILIDTDSEDYTNDVLSDFFPGAKVQVLNNEIGTEILYHRANGKVSK